MDAPPPRFARRVWIIVGVTFAFVVAIFLVITRDIDSIDDSDLALTEREIDPDQNPFPEIRTFGLSGEEEERLDALLTEERMGNPVDEAELDSLLTDLATALERFSRYAVMTQWEIDQEITINLSSPYLQPWMKLSDLKRLGAQRRIQAGEIDVALVEAIEILRFGRGFQRSRGSLIHFLVGQTIASRGQRLLAEIIQTGQLDAEDLDLVETILAETTVIPTEFIETLKVEYQGFKPMIEDLDQGDIDLASLTGSSSFSTARVPTPLTFKKNRTILLFADAYRQMIEEVPLARSEAPNLALQDAEQYQRERWRYVLSGNTIGYILYGVAIPAVDGLLDRFAVLESAHALLRVQVALERYRQETGEFPPDLAALVPRFLDAIPVDRLDGQPLRYDPEAGVIYSVGLDYLDHGGVAPDKPGTLRSRKEVVIELRAEEVPAKEPKPH